VTLAVHQSQHFRGFWAIFVVAELPPTLGSHSDPPSYSVSWHPSKRSILVRKNSLFVNDIVTVSNTRSDVSFQTKYSECLVTVELTSHTYISLRETLSYPSCLLLTVMVTPSDSNYINRSASLKRFSWIIFTPSMDW
jgi:hypothetical protein